MAAGNTLYSLLFKLGFDVGGLATGGSQARSELNSVAQAARNMAATGAPTAAAISSIGSSATATAANLRTLVSAEQAATEANKAASTAAGPLVAGYKSASGAAANLAESTGIIIPRMAQTTEGMLAAYKAAGPLVSASEAAATALKAQYAAAGPLVTSMQQQVAATGPLITGLRGANGAMAAGAPAANLAATGFQTVGNAAQGAGAAMNAVPAAAGRTVQSLKTVQSGAAAAGEAVNSFMGRVLSMAFAFSGGVAITNLFSFIANALVGFNSRLEQAHIAFTTLLGDGGVADQFIAKMQKFANFTPFDFAGVEDAAQRLMAMGVAADQVLPTLNAIGDAVSALGGTKDKLDRVVLAIGQMTTAGRVNAQDMRQLTEAGIPAWQILADGIGKTVAQTTKLAKQGLIPANDAVAILLNGMESRFSGMMARQARTAQGAFSTIRDAAYQTISAAVQPVFAAISAGMVGLADFFTSGGGRYVAPGIYAIGTAIAIALIPRLYGAAAAAGAVEVSLLGFTVPVFALIVAVTSLGIAWQENFGNIQGIVGPVLGAVGNAIGSIARFLGSLGINASVLVGIIIALATAITTRFVVSLIIAGVTMAADTIGAIALALALGALGGSAVGAAAPLGALGGALYALAGSLVAFLPAIALFAVALVLLVLNFDQVAQGARVLGVAMLGLLKIFLMPLTWLPVVGDSFKGLQTALQDVQNGIMKDMAAAEADINAKKKALGDATAGTDPLAEFRKSLQASSGEAIGATTSLVEKFGTSMDGVLRAAKEAGGKAMGEMAKGIQDEQNAPLDALKNLHTMVRNQLTPMAEIARLMGTLASADLAAGLASGDPATHAAALAVQKTVTERLDVITNGAYSAGQKTTNNLAQGLVDSSALQKVASALKMVGGPIANLFDALGGGTGARDVLNSTISKIQQSANVSKILANQWDTQWKPSANAIAEAMKGVNEQLNQMDSQALSKLNSAFNDIKQAAQRYFDAVHQKSLQAIDDAVKHKNAILDVKAALNQAPVTAAQRALDFQRRQIEEWRLRKAVADAADPAAKRDAVLALQDFLMQQHVNDMQRDVDNAKAKIDLQKKANTDSADAAKAAENLRYQRQKDDFERQLELLRSYLEKHPGEWSKANTKVLGLLHSFGFSYRNAGALLGGSFVAGLQDAFKNIPTGLPSNGIPPVFNPPGGTPKPLIPGGSPGGTQTPKVLDVGAWQILKDNTLALLHKDELVAPADAAALIRQLGRGNGASTRAQSGFATIASASQTRMSDANRESGPRSGGGGTLHVHLGDEKVGEITDRRLAIQEDTSEPRSPSTSSRR